ncbi:MAG: hypothetical protein A2144_03125 [Chloroflexi bacterium RBG_16_50_9]|nr:MAG: hypothetical protein A2144_03125 [Chloroflexi bacterium RBG_16_50_9]
MDKDILNKNNENAVDPSTPMSIEVKAAGKPQDLTDKEASELDSQADKAVTALMEARGSAVFEAADQISNVGIQDQKSISTGVALLQERMGTVFSRKEDLTTNITQDINNLQKALLKINPKDIQREKGYAVINGIPLIGKKIVDILKTSANNRMTMQQFVDHLRESLEHGELMLRQDNAQLVVLYHEVEDKQKLAVVDTYLAQLLMDKLQEATARTDDTRKKGDLEKVLYNVSARAQDLTAMLNVHEQFFVSIEMTRDNNDKLIATVRRMLTLGMEVVNVAFAIQSALQRQRRVLEAQKATRDFLGDLIVSNANMINQHIKEIGDLYKEPVIAMNKLEEACNKLEAAIDETNKLKLEGIEAARTNISKIKIMTEQLKTKAGALPDAGIRSLEASKTLSLP